MPLLKKLQVSENLIMTFHREQGSHEDGLFGNDMPVSLPEVADLKVAIDCRRAILLRFGRRRNSTNTYATVNSAALRSFVPQMKLP